MEAVIYVRFSTREQRKGSSKFRQTKDLRAFCEAKGWPVAATYIDEGMSAWSGAHRKVGEFARLEREILAGDHDGRTLVIEHLDRLSRQDPEDTFDLVRAIVREGVGIVTVNDGQKYEARGKLDMVAAITLLARSQEAHAQSEIKSTRLKASYEFRTERAREKRVGVTSWSPAWIEMKKGQRPKVIQERADLVREIFGLVDSGMGTRAVALLLNERKEPVWTTPGRTSQGWHYSRIVRLTTNRAVLGEMQPHVRDGTTQVAIGPPILDFFPAIIDADLYERVNNAAAGRRAVTGRRSKTLANLLSGLVRCDACDGPCSYMVTRKAGSRRIVNGKEFISKSADAFFVCSSHQRRVGCDNGRKKQYHTFEQRILDQVLHLALDDSLFASTDDIKRLRVEIATKSTARDRATDRARELWSAYASSASSMAMTMAGEAETQATRLSAEIVDLEAALNKARGAASAAEHLGRVAEVRSSLRHDDPVLQYAARSKVAGALRTIIQDIKIRMDGLAIVTLIAGKRILFLRADGTVADYNFDRADRDINHLEPAEQTAIRDMRRRLKQT